MSSSRREQLNRLIKEQERLDAILASDEPIRQSSDCFGWILLTLLLLILPAAYGIKQVIAPAMYLPGGSTVYLDRNSGKTMIQHPNGTTEEMITTTESSQEMIRLIERLVEDIRKGYDDGK